MVNHLYRSRDDERHQQATLLNDWAARQTLPVIAVGDYNFDWDLLSGRHDAGYDRMTAGDRFVWARPATLVTTQCSGWPCEFNSVLDFVFTAGAAQIWRAEAEIVVVPGDFPDDDTTSDHRPVLARFWPDEPRAPVATPTQAARPTATPVPAGPTANRSANLRRGPGTTYAVAGSTQSGQALYIIGRNPAGDWYQLDSGAWIAAFLVDGAPVAVAVVEAPALPTPLPPTATPVPAPPASPPQPTAPSGVAKVVIQYIYYDGQVSRVESDEYAEIANVGNAAVNIGGWRLNAGDPGQDFRFPSVDLAPGQSVRVYTNQVHPESGGFSFGSGKAIWNNKGDCGVLFDAGGQVVSERCY
ncbi:MAG: lamin tail domain-containing protein [Caldilineaceae bacterium]|nr:lamin tail domain-containing protein [Caldilineaceae bacterium]